MGDDPQYSVQAQPEKYRGEQYHSQLELKVAQVLDEYSVVYAPHVKFKVIDRTGEWHKYEVDFLFKHRQKFVGISKPIYFLEVKGVVRQHDLNRMDALEYTYNAHGFIADEHLVNLWTRDELIKSAHHVWLKDEANPNWFNE